MNGKREMRDLNAVSEEYYREHPEEIDTFLEVAFEEYAEDGCLPALLSQLRMIARVKGISALSEETGMTRNGIQKALSEAGNPKFDKAASGSWVAARCFVTFFIKVRV